MDKKPVYVVSTAHSAVSLDGIRRWSKKEYKIVEVHRPDAVKQYNASMGGIDLVDRMVGYTSTDYQFAHASGLFE